MNNSDNIDKLRNEITYDPSTGMFEWVKRGRGRALGAFLGTPVIKTKVAAGVMYVRDPDTNEYRYDDLGNHIEEYVPPVYENFGYIIRVLGVTYPAHTLAYALKSGKWCRISHLNGDKSDNRWDNLSTDMENSRRFKLRNDVIRQQKAQEMLNLRERKALLEDKVTVNMQATVEHITKMYRYDPDKGLFMRLNTKYENWDKGTPVKSNNSRALYYRDITTKAPRSCLCHIAAWILQTGSYPEGKVHHLNGDKNDNHWSNLTIR